MFKYQKTLITLKIRQSLSLGDFFHFVEGGGFIV